MNSDYNPLDSYNDSGINEIGMYSIDASDFSSGNELMRTCVVCSGDGVFFYVNAQVLSLARPHTFPLTPMLRGWLLAPGPIAQVPESARLYRRAPLCTRYFMTRHVPHHPLMVYSTAAHHGMESLAQDASPYLLGVGLEDIDDASACRMGPLVRTLKCIVLNSIPAFHTLTRRRKGCSIAIQKAMGKDWACIVTQLTWDAKSNISPHFIRDTCYRAGEGLPCQECRMNWNDCADAIAKQWARVEVRLRLHLYSFVCVEITPPVHDLDIR
ncbi:hypothetical protein BKA70DRAFT_1288043, partial [Coprinopsis sp. MPI-PUGE-AT-0042]